jgi:tripartite-type tricarboxylate transporter receptor subunit TctC
MIRVARSRLIAAALALTAAGAGAQAWPTKPIKLIVPVPAGTSPDLIGRRLVDRLPRTLGQSLVIENITGAGGLIASQAAARAAPDGYNLYFAGTGALITDRYSVKQLGYDPDRDFNLISMIYEEGSLAIAVHPDLPVKTLPELIAYAKAKPGQISYGTTSVALLILFGQWINKLGGTDMVAVAYKTQGQQIQDVLAGRTQMVIVSPPNIEAFRKAGKLRVVAVDGSGPHPLLPGIANISDTFPGFRLSGMGIMAAPTGISSDIVRRLNTVMDQAVREPEYVQALLEMGFTINGAGTPKSIADFLRDRREYWDKVMKGLNVQPE